jgi:hypothetical protein
MENLYYTVFAQREREKEREREREREREYWTKIRQVISPGQRLNTLVNPWGRPGSQVMVSLPLGLAVDHVHEVLRQTWAKIGIEPSDMMKQTD